MSSKTLVASIGRSALVGLLLAKAQASCAHGVETPLGDPGTGLDGPATAGTGGSAGAPVSTGSGGTPGATNAVGSPAASSTVGGNAGAFGGSGGLGGSASGGLGGGQGGNGSG